MKEILLTSLLVCMVGLTVAQKKTKAKPIDRDDAASLYALTNALYDYQDVYREIHTGTWSWVHMLLDDGSREKLSRNIQIEYPKVKLALDAQIKPLKDKRAVEPLNTAFQDVYTMLELSTTIQEHFKTFEDYDNDSNATAIRKLVQFEVEPLYRRIEDAFQEQILAVRNQLNVALKEQPTKLSPSELVELKYRIGRWGKLRKLKEVSWDVYDGVVKWVYVQEDSVSKIKLQTDLDDLTNLRELIVMDSLGYIGMESFAIQDLDANLDTLIVICRETMQNLVTPEHYDDPMTLLMTEDRIETTMVHAIKEVLDLCDFIDDIEKSNLEMLLANPEETKTLRKRQDIRRMLEVNEVSIMRTLNASQQQIKNNPHYERVLKKIDRKEILDGLVPIYDRLFTHEEIKEIIRFQNSAAGKKMRENALEIQLGTIQFLNTYLQELLKEEEKLNGN